jgi:hypothetical protein
MLFVIDNAKVEELRASSHASYAASGTLIDVATENYAPVYPSPPVGGTLPLGTREYLLALRRKIEASGTPLISADDLDSEIREMRR